MCSYMTVLSLRSQRYHGMTHMAAELQEMDEVTSGRTCCKEKSIHDTSCESGRHGVEGMECIPSLGLFRSQARAQGYKLQLKVSRQNTTSLARVGI